MPYAGLLVESARGTSGIKGLFDNIDTRVQARANQSANFTQVVARIG